MIELRQFARTSGREGRGIKVSAGGKRIYAIADHLHAAPAPHVNDGERFVTLPPAPRVLSSSEEFFRPGVHAVVCK